jgi:hypothetical protein
MADPSYALQKAVFEALDAIEAVPSGRVLHRVPDGTPLPFIHIGDDEIFAEYEAGEFSECIVTVHAFEDTKPKLKLIVAKVREALDAQLVLDGFGCHEWEFILVRYMTDDGVTEHAVIEFRYLVQPSD